MVFFLCFSCVKNLFSNYFCASSLSRRKDYLTQQELLQIIDSWSDSEDDFDDQEDQEIVDQEIQQILDGDLIPAAEENANDDLFDLENVPIDVIFEDNTRITLPNVNEEVCELKNAYSKIIWKDTPFEQNREKVRFIGDSDLPSTIRRLTTPLQFFKYFFTENIVQKIVEQSNYYSTENHFGININKLDVCQFIGICILSSVQKVHKVRSYWTPIVGSALIQNTMSVKKFESIKRTLHFNQNDKAPPKDAVDFDKLYKLRPLIDELLKEFKKITCEHYLSVDEQVCATKTKNSLRQYNPAKPKKWGYKIYVLSGISGFMYNFEIYTGLENKKRFQSETNLGASANVVMRLLRDVPRHNNYQIYFDNYYTSIPLLVELDKLGMRCVGTIRKDRIPNNKLPNMEKKERGACEERCASFESTSLCVVSWKDNKVVTLASTFTGIQPIQTTTRYDRKKNRRVTINCPNIIKEYNKHMGGVDLIDSFIGRHKITMKSKKWYMRIFFHLIDITVVNSWILYRKVCKLNGEVPKTLPDYRIELAESLCRCDSSISLNSSSRNQQLLDQKIKKCSASPIPPRDVRTDLVQHFPIYNDKKTNKSQNRCKNGSCKYFTDLKCMKCNVFLCLNKNRNCFLEFHTK